MIAFSSVPAIAISGETNNMPGVKITSHYQDQQVPIGELNVSGISTDNATSGCQVYLDWNDLKPFQAATATGPAGLNDYSTWSFLYSKNYHMIKEGNNELTAKVSCGDIPGSTKYYSLNVTGITADTEDPLSYGSGDSIDPKKVVANRNNDSLLVEPENPPVSIISEYLDSNIEPAISSARAEQANANNTKPDLLPAPSFRENRESNFGNTTSLEGRGQLKLIPPVADAGSDLIVNEGSSISLNASESIDPDGIILSYIWNQNPHPLITLGDAETKIWTITAPSVSSDTTFTFKLTVSDNNGLTATDSTNVLVRDISTSSPSLSSSNNAPIANAGPDLEVNENNSISLSGSASSDPDIGDSLNYSWKQTAGNPVLDISAGVDKEILTFTSPTVSVDTMFTFELIVTDKYGIMNTDIMNVLVKDIPSSSASNSTISAPSNSENQASKMMVQIEVAEDPISLGDEQTVTVTVNDATSDETIKYADIDGMVTYPSGDTKEFDDDDDGIVSYAWEVDEDSEPGTFTVDVNASAAGYEEISESISFEAVGEEEEEGEGEKQNNKEEEEND
ncbi:MAG: PKD domain-containing protein [Thermoproteota archaeon]|nr:PKD domain-containing protein [Thermoproteota archaeon]